MTKTSKIVLITILALAVLLGIGYASITRSLVIDGTANASAKDTNFNVRFAGKPVTTGTLPEGITFVAGETENLTSSFTVSGFTTKDQEVNVKYTVNNESIGGLKAKLTPVTLTGTDNYFDVTTDLTSETEIANGGSTEITLTIKLLKTPVEDKSTTIKFELKADAVEE